MASCYIASDYEYLPGLFSSLTDVLAENQQYYLGINDGKKSQEFAQCFGDLLEITAKTLKLLLEVAAVSPLFDFDPNTKGNGYRTIVRVIEMCFRRLHALGQYFQDNRDRLLFRSDHYYKEIVSYLELSKGLFKFLEFAKLLLEWGDGNDLFPPEDHYDAKMMTETHLHAVEKECFYGRRFVFHFNTALRGFLTAVSIAMVSFGDGYAKHDGSFTVAAATILNGPKYLINPDLRAKRLTSLSTIVDMQFCKAFWTLTERYGLQHFPSVVSSSLKVNELFEIPPIPIEVTTESGEKITIQPPSSWTGPAPVDVHLLSYLLREGQTRDKDGNARYNSQAKRKADGLIIHIHGGGFVAQSSKSHEIYLRSWAKSLNVPILSIDYALAPEQPFPRALEECLFAYIWALKNFDRLGTTGKYIALAGDSAGGNLCVSLCLKAASYGVRLPDGILASYAPFMVQFRPSPSRLLTLLDPLLPIGILTACLAAYTGASAVTRDENDPTSIPIPTTILENGDVFRCAENAQSLPSSDESASTTTGIKTNGTSGDIDGFINAKNTHNAVGSGESVSPQADSNGILENGNEISLNDCCCCEEDSNMLPDVVQDIQSDSGQVSYSSNGVDLIHSRKKDEHATQSESALSSCSKEEPGEAALNELKSCALLMTDDYFTAMSKNPLMSPLLASNEELAKLPPIDLLACSMDPLFDDSIEFAKRLREVGNKVELYIVDDLPHGFLSFYMVCQEGREANELCIACIKKILLGKRNIAESCTPPIY